MNDIDYRKSLYELLDLVGKHRLFYYNYDNKRTTLIDRKDNSRTHMDYLSDDIVKGCNTFLGNTMADVEAAVACEIAGDWSDFDTHFVRQGAMEQLKLEI